jgi:lactoylglutathione lyase
VKIEHVGLWALDLERAKDFYERYFGAQSGPKYLNAAKGFSSYFLSFESGARIEIMHRHSVAPRAAAEEQSGYAHLAFSAGDEPAVDALTHRLKQDGYAILDGPRRTGDGYYESVVLDPEGNRIEITA